MESNRKPKEGMTMTLEHVDFRENEKVGEKVCSCGATIHFARTSNGGSMPFDPDTGKSHFLSCPHANRYSGKNKAANRETKS